MARMTYDTRLALGFLEKRIAFYEVLTEVVKKVDEVEKRYMDIGADVDEDGNAIHIPPSEHGKMLKYEAAKKILGILNEL